MGSREVNEITSFKTSGEVDDFLFEITKYHYDLAEAVDWKWGDAEPIGDVKSGVVYYQIMPDTLDDGFFDWYCEVRAKYQFHKTPEMCVAYFLKYWIFWTNSGRPKASWDKD